MKRFTLFLLALVLVLTSVPTFAADENYMYAVGELTKEEFIANYAYTGDVTPKSGTTVGTGSKLTRDGNDYTVVVRGDINGDGLIKSADYLKIKKYFTGASLNELEAKAADVNADGGIKSGDYLKLKQYFSGAFFSLWSADDSVGERYMGFKIWNHKNARDFTQLKRIIDNISAAGFNLVNYEINWCKAEPSKGVYDFADHDRAIEYMVNKGMKVCLVLSLFRESDTNDTILEYDDFMMDDKGKTNPSYKGYGISPASPNAVRASSEFVYVATKHYVEKFGRNIMMVCPDISRYFELEYSINTQTDYSKYAVEGYREFLEFQYDDITAANKALGTGYKSFEDIVPPSNSDTSNNGLMWFTYKSDTLACYVDALNMAVKEVRDDIKFCLQVGSVNDGAAVRRGTLDIGNISMGADVVWTDNGPGDNHGYQMDYLRSATAGKEIGNEADGSVSFDSHTDGPELLLDQGDTSFMHGAKYFVCANWCDHIGNWSVENPLREYFPIFRGIADKWLGNDVPKLETNDKSKNMIFTSLYDFFVLKDPLYNAYYDGSAGFVIDSTDFLIAPETNAQRYRWPARFSSVSGTGGFSYKAMSKGNLLDMTYSGNFWALQTARIGKGVMQMGQKIWPVIEFKVPKDGAIAFNAKFSVIKDSTAGINVDVYGNDMLLDSYSFMDYLEIVMNGKEDELSDLFYVDILNDANAKALTGVLMAEKGDVLRFVVSPKGMSVNENVFGNIEIEYVDDLTF